MFKFAHKVSFALGVMVACAHGLCGMERIDGNTVWTGESGAARFYAQAIRNIDPKKWKTSAQEDSENSGGKSVGKDSLLSSISPLELIKILFAADIESVFDGAAGANETPYAFVSKEARVSPRPGFAKCNPRRGPTA